MMYDNKLVLAVKANGKVLREFKDTVFVPFGSEYSLLLKNLNTVRALADITIDGVDVCPGGLVIDAGREVNLERFVTKGNMSSGNRFKFIERSEAVEAHRGVKMDDGIIRVAFKFEKPLPPKPYNSPTYPTWPSNPWIGGSGGPLGQGGWHPGNMYGNNFGDKFLNNAGAVHTKGISTSNNVLRSRGVEGSSSQLSAQSYASADAAQSYVSSDVGITVPGSISNQSFTNVYMRELEQEEHVIVMLIRGESEQGNVVREPVTVKAKPTCVTCGRVNKATSKFCSQCGTALTII